MTARRAGITAAGLLLVTLLLSTGSRSRIERRTPFSRTAGRKGGEALQRYDALLSPSALRRGLAYTGGGHRLADFAAKLARGEAVTVLLLGGSITASQHKQSYGKRFETWLNRAFPRPPGGAAQHAVVNGGIPGTSSSSIPFSLCPSLAPPDSVLDLFVLEFAVNDAPAAELVSEARAAYERLLRRALGAPGRPAVLLLESFAYISAQGQFWGASSEMHQALVGQYYDVPVLSLRNAAFHLFRRGVPGFRVDKTTDAMHDHMRMHPTALPANSSLAGAGAADRTQDFFFQDQAHPSPEQGHRALADLLVAAVATAAEQRLNGRQAVASLGSLGDGEEEEQELPPPMLPGTDQPLASRCIIQEDLATVVVASEGFQYEAFRPDRRTFIEQKWAWSAKEAGAWAELELDLREQAPDGGQPGAEGAPASPDARVVYLGYQRSYETMGLADVSCASGCTCAPATLNGTWARHTTQPDVLQLEVVQLEDLCRIRVTSRVSNVNSSWTKTSLVALAIR